MQKTVYTCDGCGQPIGEVAHISIAIAQNGMASGVALPPHEPPGLVSAWKVSGFPEHFFHLHAKCATPYFKRLIESKQKKAKDKKK